MVRSSTDNLLTLFATSPPSRLYQNEPEGHPDEAEISKEYDFASKSRWVGAWDESIYYFDWNSSAPQYIIDTPPYPPATST